MAWDFNTEVIAGILEEAGFDTVVRDNISAVRDEGTNNHQLYINSKGRMRYQYSEQLKNSTKQITVIGKAFHYELENRDIINISGVFSSLDDLVSFLQNITQVLQKRETR